MLANMWYRFEPGPFGGYGLWRLGGMIMWLLLLGLLGALLITLLRRRDVLTKTETPGGGTGRDLGAAPAPTPLDVAKMRYARGELTKEEFEALKQDLE
jgi:putative membrane protein